MLSISRQTGLQSLGEDLHTFSNGFLQQGGSDPLHCVLQLGNCFWYSMVFVAIASYKNVD